ncbi:hypothetical protein CISIN_1g047112mg [Citrus sinensis]|uniref:Uncharacterized protein n=2 Tax=Citrus TaxID=2706 RepID=A0A067DLC1_CITSI|nr:hypothetical protein CISIN_1g047112mg [Citrus sinensis]
MYINDPKLGKGWKVVAKVQHRGVWDIQEKDEVVEDTQEQEEYQQSDSIGNGVLKVQQDDLDVNLFSRNDVAPTKMALRRNKRPRSLPSSSYESRAGAAAASTISDRHSSTGRVALTISAQHKKATRPLASKLSSECGVIVRTHAPLKVELWKHIP